MNSSFDNELVHPSSSKGDLVKPSPDKSIQPKPNRTGGDVVIPHHKPQQPIGKPGRLDD